MSTTQVGKPWDFSSVYELINTLDSKQTVPQEIGPPTSLYRELVVNSSHSLPNDSPLAAFTARDTGGVSLGNFDKVWEFLGAPADAPAPQFSRHPPKTSPTLQDRVPVKTDYTSDGAVYLTPGKKNIQWRDEANGGNLTDVAPDPEDEVKLTKTQRKKKNRAERKRLAAEGLVSASDMESEPEQPQERNTPARKASAHVERSATFFMTPARREAQSFFEKRERSRSPTKQSAAKGVASTAAPTTPKAKSSAALITPATEGKNKDKKEWPVTKALWGTISQFQPASVKPSRHADPTRTTIKPNGKIEAVQNSPSKGKSNLSAIKPKIVRTGEDRDLALLLKLVSAFYEDKSHLVKPANLSNHSSHPDGIHVFVDASNIFIGFHDQLKRSRDIPQHHHVPRVDMSFGALALLMERRRPIAKRVLVGSKPNMPAFDTAREIGYECNILDKVLKARELTDRQKYFQQLEHERKLKSNGGHRGSGSETTGGGGGGGPVYAPEAFVEQGVDEILHLKMMESIIDAERPSTMVLATGDAAQAEYSQGFMKMAQRALQKGWKLELVSWSKNISQAYKKAEFRREWGDRFKIVELDDYAEELLDM